jgi:hypothetical protein
VQHVAGVVAEREQHAPALVGDLRDRVHLLGTRRGEEVAHGGARGEAGADESAERRVVAASAADHDGDLRLGGAGRADDAAGNGADPARGCGGEALHQLVGEIVGVVEQSRHWDSLRRGVGRA